MNDSSPFHHCDSCRWPFPDSKCHRTTYLLRHPFSHEGYEYVFNSKATWHVYPSPICDHSLQLLIAQPYYSYKPHAPQASVTTPNKHTWVWSLSISKIGSAPSLSRESRRDTKNCHPSGPHVCQPNPSTSERSRVSLERRLNKIHKTNQHTVVHTLLYRHVRYLAVKKKTHTPVAILERHCPPTFILMLPPFARSSDGVCMCGGAIGGRARENDRDRARRTNCERAWRPSCHPLGTISGTNVCWSWTRGM